MGRLIAIALVALGFLLTTSGVLLLAGLPWPSLLIVAGVLVFCVGAVAVDVDGDR